MKITFNDFDSIKEQFIFDMEMEDIPPELVFNWDQTGISIVPGSSWTMVLKGAKESRLQGSVTSAKSLLCCVAQWLEISYPLSSSTGKTTACLPRYKFPDNWHIMCTPNHWSNEKTMIEYIKKVIIPYVQQKRNELKLSPEQAALALFDVFRGQQTECVSTLLEENNIVVVPIPANCTDRLQPMDLSVNKAVKEFMRSRFREWYATEGQKQLDDGAQQITPVDLKMSTMKPLGARWLVSLHDHVNKNDSLILNGFKAAGIL